MVGVLLPAGCDLNGPSRHEVTQSAYHECHTEMVDGLDALHSVDPRKRRLARRALAAEKRVSHTRSTRAVFKHDFVSCVQEYVYTH